MKILFLTHYFQPEPNFFFGLPFAEELVRRGHEVEVLTGFPNYPGGKIYPEYRNKFFMTEVMNGIRVHRFPLYPSHGTSALKRILCYASLSMAIALYTPLVSRSFDVAYVCQGPATLGLPALLLKMLKNIPYVYHVQDIWPESLFSTGMFNSKLAYKCLDKLCGFVYKNAEKVVVISPGMKDVITQKNVSSEKFEIIYNWCDEKNILNSPVARFKIFEQMKERFNVIFAGNMGKAQSLSAVLQAAPIVAKEAPEVQFVFIGGGVEKDNLIRKSQEMNLQNIVFHERVTSDQIGYFLKKADVLLVHLKDDPLFRITIPSKTQAYLATGKPLLMAVKGDAADLVKKAGAGIIVEPENPQDIARGVIELAQMNDETRCRMGELGAQFYRQNMSFERAADRFEKIFTAAVKGNN
ncbi:MAG: glycosyltransferase family 4 protein [Desulforhopalus sp.]|nr:glycosyltransferase family 4 protein [Desulforhopalus sp.]